MRLRNKKTGGIFDVAFHSSYKDGKITIGVEVDADPKYPKCNFSDYESLEEFCENWEDYKPAEPLIKDEKVRKAVRAWSKAEKLKKVFVFNLNVLGKNLIMITEGNNGARKITFKGRWKIAEGFYTITELCGDEEVES